MLSPSQKRSLLAQQELFAKLTDRELDDLLQAVHSKAVDAREELCHKDDPGNQLFVIVDGLLKAQATSASGDDMVLSIMGPGEMFGELALFCGGKRTANVVAIQDSNLLSIDRRDLFPFLRRHPDAAIKLLEVLAFRLQHLTSVSQDNMFLTVEERLAKRLLELIDRYGTPIDDGIRIEMRVSQSDLGDIVVATRESINKTMRTWRTEDVASMRGGFVIIHDQKRLLQIADGSVTRASAPRARSREETSARPRRGRAPSGGR